MGPADWPESRFEEQEDCLISKIWLEMAAIGVQNDAPLCPAEGTPGLGPSPREDRHLSCAGPGQQLWEVDLLGRKAVSADPTGMACPAQWPQPWLSWVRR